MQAFDAVHGIAVPMDRENVDTDAIVPQRWLVTVERRGLGVGLFGSWRYDAHDRPRADFVLNRPAYQGACILVAGANYGCGSSREHAVWAHLDWGIRAVIAPSFGPIFQENALKNGLLPVVLPPEAVRGLLDQLLAEPGARCGVDLHRCEVTDPAGRVWRFEMDAGRRQALLDGVDDIDLALALSGTIAAFQDKDLAARPWTEPSRPPLSP